jgi:hypothetical protein
MFEDDVQANYGQPRGFYHHFSAKGLRWFICVKHRRKS